MKGSTALNAHATTVACISTAILAVTGYSYYTYYKTSSKKAKEEQFIQDENDVNSSTVGNSNCNNNKNNKPNSIPMEIDTNNDKTKDSSLQRIQTTNTITIAYASTTGTCQSFAKSLHESLTNFIHNNETNLSATTKIQICTVDELDWWDELLNNENSNDTHSNGDMNNTNNGGIDLPPMVIFVLPTWTNGSLPEQYATLLTSLDEISHDWRVAPRPLRNEEFESSKKAARSGAQNSNSKPKRQLDTKTIQIASFGMGSTAYDKSTFCKPAKDVFKTFMKLGAKSLLVSHGKGVVGTGDDDAGDCKKSFGDWKDRVMSRVDELMNIQMESQDGDAVMKKNSGTNCQKGSNENVDGGGCACQEDKSSNEAKEGCCQSGESKMNENDDYFGEDGDDYSDDDYSAEESIYDDEEEKEPDVMDLEDIGNAMQTSKKNQGSKRVKEMVTPKQAAALKKEGYRIIGTHSAVKLCRWTKHQLRGRGGCYKHTFYGITSYQCMEATPSLACANKCKIINFVGG